MKNQGAENIVENISEEKEISFSQEAVDTGEIKESNSVDLKEFGVDTDEPDLFSHESQSSNTEDLIRSDDGEEEDDLEIPAFLRRQKN